MTIIAAPRAPATGSVSGASSPHVQIRDSGMMMRLETICVMATVFLAPMNYFRLELLYFTASDLLAVVTFLIMLANGTLSGRFFGIGTTTWLVSTCLFIVGLSVASIVRGSPIDLAVVLVQYGFTLVLLPMILGGRTRGETVLMLKVLILSIVVIMIIGAYVMNFVDDPHWRLVSWSGRMRSLVERENECAMLGAIAIVLVLGLYSHRALSALWLLSLPPLLYGILLTGSNSGLILTIFGGLFIIAICGSARLIVAVLATTCLLIFSLLAFGDVVLPEVFRDRVLRAIVENDVTLAGTLLDRLFLYQEAIRLSEDNLLVGLGANQYREASAYGAQVHNAYLLALTEGGLLALIGLVGLTLSAIFTAGMAFITGGGGRLAAISITVTLIYLAALNLFPTFYARFFLVPFILTTALAASTLPPSFRILPENHGKKTPSRGPDV